MRQYFSVENFQLIPKRSYQPNSLAIPLNQHRRVIHSPKINCFMPIGFVALILLLCGILKHLLLPLLGTNIEIQKASDITFVRQSSRGILKHMEMSCRCVHFVRIAEPSQNRSQEITRKHNLAWVCLCAYVRVYV